MISKKKTTCSPHTPKEEEEEEEEEEAGGTESDEGSAGEREVEQCAQEEPEGRRGGVPTEAGQPDASPKPNNSPQTPTDTGVMDESVKQHAGGQSSENGGQNVELKEASAEEQSDLVTCEKEGDIAPSKETEPADPMDVEVCEGSGPAGSDSCVPPSQLTHNGTTGKMDEDSHAGLFATNRSGDVQQIMFG